MTENFWVQLLANGGASLLILFALGLFIHRAGWPFVREYLQAQQVALKEQSAAERLLLKEQLDRAQQERREERALFLAALDKRDQVNRQLVEEINLLTEAVEALRADRRA